MSHRTLIALCLVSALACKGEPRDSAGSESAIALPPDNEESSLSSRDYRSVAENVVAQSAGVQEGDLVLLFGRDQDLHLLEDLAVEVRKRGGSSLVSVGSDRIGRRMYDEVPAKYDAQTPEMMAKLAGIVDVVILTESEEGRAYKGVPPERIAARGKAAAPISELMRKRGVRTVALGNGLYPTAERAEQFGVSPDELADMMFGGLETDYQKLQATGQQVRQMLASGKELRITNPNGTDLRVGIAGQPVRVNDGIISPEDRKQGGGATSVWLPAGEVYLVPVAGTGTGTVIADQFFYLGEPITKLKLDFKDGKLISMTAEEGLEPLQAAYNAAGQGKDLLGVIDLGINAGIQSPDRSPLHVWAKTGTVTVSVGDNTWAGGDNRASFGFAAYSPGSSVTVDGKPLIQDGKLVVGEGMAVR
ncbi:MAG TPA: aminopeptidase [Gemmatimonadales bacterium]|nr:aminopeptidase [Gemmatimonadales bacterium]